jgi:hypothetical protein
MALRFQRPKTIHARASHPPERPALPQRGEMRVGGIQTRRPSCETKSMSPCQPTASPIISTLADRAWTLIVLVVGALLGNFSTKRREREKRQLAIYDQAREILVEFGVLIRRNQDPDAKFIARETGIGMQIAEWFPKSIHAWREVDRLISWKGQLPDTETEYSYDQKKDAALAAMRSESKTLSSL